MIPSQNHLFLQSSPPQTHLFLQNRSHHLHLKDKPQPTQASAALTPSRARRPNLDSAALTPTGPPSSTSAAVNKPPLLIFTVKSRNPNPTPSLGGFSGGSSRFQSRSSSESSLGENDNGFDDDDDVEGNRRHERFLVRGFGSEKRKWEGLVGCERGRGGGGEMGELARAIVNFADVYERVETSKQQQVMELERHRMELEKELEFQRMKMFMEAQLEIKKMRMERPKYSSGSGSVGVAHLFDLLNSDSWFATRKCLCCSSIWARRCATSFLKSRSKILQVR